MIGAGMICKRHDRVRVWFFTFVATLVIAYPFLSVPTCHAQHNTVLSIPTLQTPVTLDGRWEPQGEYRDAREVDLYLYPSISGEFGHLEFKYDTEWTYIYLEFIADTKEENTQTWNFLFDTMNQVYERPNTPGVYTLNLKVTPTNVTVSTDPLEPGIPFSPEDYRFKYFFGPSPNRPEDHSNLEVQFSTKKLTDYIGINSPDKTIGFRCYLMDYQLQLYRYPSLASLWQKTNYSGVPIPEIPIAPAAAVFAIALVMILVVNRRSFLAQRVTRCDPT
jgi:hypothetical protein